MTKLKRSTAAAAMLTCFYNCLLGEHAVSELNINVAASHFCTHIEHFTSLIRVEFFAKFSEPEYYYVQCGTKITGCASALKKFCLADVVGNGG